jgi:hypothetical protein
VKELKLIAVFYYLPKLGFKQLGVLKILIFQLSLQRFYFFFVSITIEPHSSIHELFLPLLARCEVTIALALRFVRFVTELSFFLKIFLSLGRLLFFFFLYLIIILLKKTHSGLVFFSGIIAHFWVNHEYEASFAACKTVRMVLRIHL